VPGRLAGRHPGGVAGPECQPQLVAVLRGIHAPPGRSFDRVDAVADGVPVDAQSGGGGPPVAVVLENAVSPRISSPERSVASRGPSTASA
jgi:hypothetical protein